MEANKVNEKDTELVLKYLKQYREISNPQLKVMGVEFPYSHIRKLILSGYKIESRVKHGLWGPTYWIYRLV